MIVTRLPVICNCILFTALLLLLAACPDTDPADQAQGGVPGASTTATTPELPAGEVPDVGSVFAGTGYDTYEPLAFDFPHGLERVYLKKLGPEGLPTLVESFAIGESLEGHAEFVRSSELLRAYVKGHPHKDECLLVSHRQDSPEEPIRDVLWRTTPGSKVELDYLSVPGLPAELPYGTTYNTEPVYSYDGDFIAILLNSGGICVLDQVSGEQRFIEYLPLPGAPTGHAVHTAPSPEGQSFLVLSRWYIGRGDEWCQLALLDLVSGEWLRTFEINDPGNPARQWVIYEIAGENLAEGPWLVRGSRAPNVTTEHKRVPRLALLDPDTGYVDLLMFHGDPYWPLALEETGRYVTYLDQQRQAIVRLDLEEQRLDVDPRFYADEAKLFIGRGGSPVYVWSDTLLFEAKFTEAIDVSEE